MSNRYLEGGYAPVVDEVTAVDLPVTGTVPAWLDGRYLRNGPNPIDAGDPATYHWFTGDGMVHGVRLRDGRAEWYRNRYVRSSGVAEALGETWAGGPVHAEMDAPANTNVIGHAGRTFAIVESGPRPYELTDELETVGPSDFDGTLPGGYTAHPKRDPLTGELHAVSYFWGWGNNVQYTVTGVDGRVRKVVDIETTGSPMLHDCSLTESAVLIYDLPVDFDLDMAMGGSRLPYRWFDSEPARVGVLPRDGAAEDVRWFDVEPCYVFHPLNAYDDGDNIVVDLVRHPKMFATDHLGPNEGEPSLDRWTIDRSAGKVLEERLDDRAQEFPRVDERLVGRRHRYGWSVALSDDPEGNLEFGANALLKHDLVRGTSQTRSFGPRSAAGEFVHIAPSPDAAEDEGVVMGFVLDGGADTTDLVILDAGTMDDVARIHLPARVPHGFHGNWVPTA
jgi:carotenoid cleavage dioxygenase